MRTFCSSLVLAPRSWLPPPRPSSRRECFVFVLAVAPHRHCWARVACCTMRGQTTRGWLTASSPGIIQCHDIRRKGGRKEGGSGTSRSASGPKCGVRSNRPHQCPKGATSSAAWRQSRRWRACARSARSCTSRQITKWNEHKSLQMRGQRFHPKAPLWGPGDACIPN